MSRIPFDKAHKTARRIANRQKEQAKTLHLRRDDSPIRTPRGAKRSRRVAMVMATFLAFLAGSAPSMARGTVSHHKASPSHASHAGVAISGFRAQFTR